MSTLHFSTQVITRLSALLLIIAVIVLASLLSRVTSSLQLTELPPASSAVPKPVIRIADMLGSLRTLLVDAGEDTPAEYQLEWSNFTAGPAIVAAAVGGSVDIGWMMETPLVFAQAAGSPVSVIAAAVPVNPEHSGIALAVAKASAVQTVAELKGKKVLYLPGTIHHYVLVQWLQQAGLNLADIVPVNVAAGAAVDLLARGDIDAAVLLDPVLVQAESSGKVRLLAGTDKAVSPGVRYLVVPDRILRDPASAAVLTDLVGRWSRAYQWQIDHPQLAAASLARLYKITPAQAATVLARSLSRVVPITPDIIAAQQREADTFTRLGLIRTALDVRTLFTTQFSQPLTETATP